VTYATRRAPRDLGAEVGHRRRLGSLVGGGLTRAVLLPVTGIAALLVGHIEIAAVGPDRFGVLTLLIAITLLFPFADFGIGAAVTNAVARRDTSRRHERLIGSSTQLLCLAAVAVVAIGGIASAARAWARITGVKTAELPALDRDMFIVIALFAIGLPLGLGGRILLGLDRYPVFVLIQGAIPLTTLVLVAGFRNSTDMTPFLLAPFIAQDIASLVALIVALRMLRMGLRSVWPDFGTVELADYREIGRSAVPMLIITLALPVALQTDRLVLSHVASRHALADYAIVSLLYIPTWSIVSTAGMSLWPRFAAGSSVSRTGPLSYPRAFRLFALTGAVCAVALVLLGPVVTRIWAGTTGGSLLLWGVFGALLIVQAGHLPGAMYLTRPAGLRFQAACVTVMCVANLPLSIVLAKAWGSVGPPLASAATILAFQLVPARRWILRGRRPIKRT
jgi:O-antigen/teichoic acid export membrane protein